MEADNEILFAWREFATTAAAITALGRELRAASPLGLTAADGEALARTMIKFATGTVDQFVWWRHNDAPEGIYGLGDLIYSTWKPSDSPTPAANV